ncbi:MAG: class II SORL domain-containing protein [Nitrospirae bacterium]|nr:class II SORL domain-containing protein [Nitrospirota bacterium]
MSGEKGLFCGINQPKDASNLSEMEKKHVPVIECPDRVKSGEPFKVTVKVGSILHVSEEGHHIQWIDVKSGDNLYARIELTPVLSKPEATVTLVKAGKHRTGTIRVVERCNLHGLWEAKKDIVVED